ncbi:Chaperonin (heat shock protein 33) [Halanaerobium saccharolyticum subsp. saccharolyticum DSM 6643]|uniref:33 kDa chaperonin n=1 Tax=Halanaerobium saccharolyticum subsp. saccharolyticum DSM 6643 TaxID=1293054 RepID=M5EAK5_9FIRM|nr:Hsp33 family molecular chaperone HslO [Halanaerobium saccharolyticum]CCU77779.1 Chaperonin (heat shock protein 33) [Halanaerobium saccharolyticum subsp. saccharolyticum DSM 6643]
MDDYLIRAITTNKEIRALAVKSTNVVREAQERHQTTPVATAALGRVITGALLTGSLVKSGDEIVLKIEGTGPAGKIVADANQEGEVRGYIQNPKLDLYQTDSGKLDVAKAVGAGELSLTKIMRMKEPYKGSVPLVSGEIGEDLTYYFTASEQVPSAVGLGVLVDTDLSVKAAGGFIIQLLPDAAEETIEMLEKNLENITSVSKMIEGGMTPEELLTELLGDMDYRIMARKDVKFKCRCSRERSFELIAGLGKDEIEETLAEQGEIEVRCHFCNSTYNFKKEEVEELIKELEAKEKEIPEVDTDQIIIEEKDN